MNYKLNLSERWGITLAILGTMLVVGTIITFAFLSSMHASGRKEPSTVECFEGVFAEQLQPRTNTLWMQQVWLCGKGLHYQFIQPDEDMILNHRTSEYYEQKELDRDSVH